MNGNRWTLMLTWSLLVLALVLMGLMAGQSGHAQSVEVAAPRAELRVCTEGPPSCNYAVIQDAVDAAAEGDVVKVAAGVYTSVQARPAPPGYDGPVVITQAVYLSKTLTLQGGYTLTNWTEPDPGANPTTLDAQGQGRVMVVAGTISPTVAGLRLTGGDATGLEGSYNGYDAGGGVYIYTASITISDCHIYSNTASTAGERGYGGGLYLSWADGATLSGNTVRGNVASTAAGGGIWGLGGGLFAYQSPALLEDNIITSNTAGPAGYGWGGGLQLHGSDGIVLVGNTVQGNTASIADRGWGGGMIFTWSDDVTLTGNTVQDNVASETDIALGGGLVFHHSGGAMLTGNTVQDNIASETGSGDGGGLRLFDSDGTTLAGNLMQGNVASVVSSGQGGGLWISESDITLESNIIISNTAALSPAANGHGGGLRVEGGTTLTMTNNVVAGNRATTGASGTGDGLWLDAIWETPINGWLLHNTLADNVGPGGRGQGIYAGMWVTLTLSNTIIAGHDGVGITVTASSTATLEGTLWHDNGADTGGDGTIIIGTVNVYGDPAFVDPTTGDYHLSPDSAAIDAGVDAGTLVDIDGDPRPLGLGYDIGADEVDLAGTGCYARLNDGLIYPTVQAAVDASTQPGDVVKVAGYCTGVEFRGGLTQTVYLSKTLALRGGYTLTNWTEPDPEAYPSTLDAGGLGRVLVVSGTVSPTVEGLRLIGGDATDLGGLSYGSGDAGGGVYVYTATATISSCVIYSNTASTANRGNGGGLFLRGSDAMLLGNTVRGNVANAATWGNGYGGGLYLYDSGATLEGNVVINNTASTGVYGDGYGGGLYLNTSAATLEGNAVISNTATLSTTNASSGGGLFLYESAAMLSGNKISTNAAYRGGGLYSYYSEFVLEENKFMTNTASWGGGLYVAGQWSGGTFIENTIQGNSAYSGGGLYLTKFLAFEDAFIGNVVRANSASYGGGLYTIDCSFPLQGNVISANVTEYYGGGMYCFGGCGFWVNNIVVDNVANASGSGLYVAYSSPQMFHSTIARNHGGDGSGVYVEGSAPDYSNVRLKNTILVSHAVGISVTLGNSVTLEATLWGSGSWANDQDWTGEGTVITGTINIRDEPAFVTPDAGDYHLGPGSAAIDAGVDAGITIDIDGEPRPMGAGYDIGADEVLPGPRLAVTKRAHPDPVQSGGQVTYTLRLTNTGTVSLTTIITDILPVHVTPGGIFTWTPATLLPGETWTEAFVVTVETDYTGWLTNVVQVTTEEGALGTYTNTVVVEEAIAGLSIENDSPTLLGDLTTLTATVTAGSNVNYAWAFGDGELGSGATVSHVYPGVGIYTAVVTASNSVSELAATTAVTITDVPIEGLAATNDSPTVLGEPTTLTATVMAGSNVTYTWALGDGTSGDGVVVAHTYPAVGVYTAVVTASNSVGELTATTTVVVEEAIAGLTAVNDSPTVLGEATTLTATVTAGSNVTYTWALGDGTFDGGAVVSHTYPTIGVYTTVVTASNSVSELTATTTVIVEEAIEELVVANDSPTVLGEATTLTATVTAGSNVSYTWALGDGTFDGGAVVAHTYPAEGVYTAVVTASNSVGELTATTQVIITGDEIPIEGLVAVNDSPTVLGDPATLTATVTAGSNVSYTWALGDGTFDGGAAVSHTYSTTGVYTAVVTASNSVGELTATTRVTITEPGFSIYLPLVLRQSP